ncbi:tetratricopeptide repeat protein [Geodermatophilus sp. SYSU D00691]
MIAGPAERVVAAVQTLLAQAQAATTSGADPELPFRDGALVSRIVARGHGTDFDGGELVDAHGHFLLGIERHLRAAADAHREYELARLAYMSAKARTLARLAAFASATVKRTLLIDGDDTEVCQALSELQSEDAACTARLRAALEPYVEVARWISRVRSGVAGTEPDIAVDVEGARLLRSAALAHSVQLVEAVRLARLADTYPAPPGEASTRRTLADSLALQRRWQEAIEVLADLRVEDPADGEVIARLAHAYLELDRWPEGRQLFVDALHDPLEPGDVQLLRELVPLAYSAHDPEADTWRQHLVALDPGADPFAGMPAPTDMGGPQTPLLAAFHDGELQVDPDWTELPPDEQRAHMTAAIIAGSPEGQQLLLQLLEDDAPLAQRVLALLGLRVLTPQQAQARAHFTAGEEHFAARRFAEAQREYEAALELDPEHVEAATYLADTWYRRGAYHRAQAFFEESLAIRPTAMAYRFLGDSLHHGGHGARRARESYRRALQLDPGYAGARMALAALEESPDEPISAEEPAPVSVREPAAPSAAPSGETPPGTAQSSPLADALDATGRVGDRVLAGFVRMAGPDHIGIAHVVDDDEQFAAWLAGASPREIAQALMLAVTVSFQYQAKDRDVSRWKLWVRRELAMAEALPHSYGPADDPMELGRDRHLADALRALAEVRENEGSLGEARSLYERAVAHLDAEERARESAGLTHEAEFDRLFSATSVRGNFLEHLATVCQRLGDTEAATEYRQEAGRLNQARPTTEAEVDALLAGGRVAMREGEVDRALGTFQHALYLAEDEDPDPLVPRMLTTALNGLGEAYRTIGAVRAALGHFDRARRLNEGTGNSDRLAFDHRSIARILEDRPALGADSFGDALHHLEQALVYASLADPAGDAFVWTASDGVRYRVIAPDRAWPTLLQIAGLLQRRGDDQAAVQYLEIAARIADVVRDGVVEEQQRIAVRNEQVQAFADLTSARIRLARRGEPDAAEHARAAWLANESVRARTFLDVLGDTSLTPPPSVPAELVNREHQLLLRRRELRESHGRGADF